MAARTNEPPPPLVAIACQGGGSHAAFGAGVIHRLLEDYGQRFRLQALSGTSGGAVNAVLTWSGLIHGGARKGVAEAQRRLHGMWEDLGAASIPDMIRNWWGQFVLDLPFTWEVSPYVWDLGAREEMISRLEKWANLVRRRGTAYWDGLFSINPPIYALTQIRPCPDEIWVIQINPQRVRHAPTDMRDIVDRRNELGGNVSLNKELDMIETINGLLADGHLQGGDYQPITVRVVGLEETAGDRDLTYASKFNRDPAFLRELFDHGRDRASEFYDATWSRRDNVTHRLAALAKPTR